MIFVYLYYLFKVLTRQVFYFGQDCTVLLSMYRIILLELFKLMTDGFL